MTERHYFYPNNWGRLILAATEDVIGPQAIADVLRQAGIAHYIGHYPPDDLKRAFPFEHVGALWKAMYLSLGSERTRQVAREVGQRNLDTGLIKFREVTAAISPVLYKGSLEKKIKMGLEVYARLFNMLSDQAVYVDQDDSAWYWRVTRCPVCWGWHGASEPVCYLISGILEAAYDWASDGRQAEIVETECIARGDKQCTVRISKTPLG